MRKWILRLLNGVPKENITLVGLIQASTMEELNRAIAEVYHSHVYRHRPRKGTTKNTRGWAEKRRIGGEN